MTTNTLDAVRDLVPRLRERAVQAERDRRVSAESIDELRAVGVFRLLQPGSFGGAEADPMDLYEVVRLVAGACGSTGWVTSVVGVHPWQLALFEVQAQKEVWEDPDALVSSSYAPTGTARVVDDGFLVSGRWNFSSGADHCDWVFLGAAATDDDGNLVDFGTFLLPRADYVVDDVWNTIGLRGSGSNDIVVNDAFVPAHRMLSFRDTSAIDCPGHAVNDAATYRLPFASVFSNCITAAILGTAGGVYDACIERARDRVRLAYGQKVSEDPFAQTRIARAASELDAGWLQLSRNMRELKGLAEGGQPIPMELRTQVRRDQVLGTDRALRAVDLLFENAGGHALVWGNPVERGWRDCHAGRVHAINDLERGLAMYGASSLGLPVNEPMV